MIRKAKNRVLIKLCLSFILSKFQPSFTQKFGGMSEVQCPRSKVGSRFAVFGSRFLVLGLSFGSPVLRRGSWVMVLIFLATGN